MVVMWFWCLSKAFIAPVNLVIFTVKWPSKFSNTSALTIPPTLHVNQIPTTGSTNALEIE